MDIGNPSEGTSHRARQGVFSHRCLRKASAADTVITGSEGSAGIADALRLLGEIAGHGAPPDVELAETHYRQALALADELGMRPLQAHCHLGLGTLYATTGQHEQARTELSAAIELYRGMEMQFWLPQAETALAQVK